MKKIVAFLTVFIMLFTNAYAFSGYSDWMKDTLSEAEADEIVPECLSDADISKPITRGEFAALMLKLCEKVSETTAEPAENPFSNKVGEDILKAVKLGIVKDFYGSGEFISESYITREEAAVMIANAYIACEDIDIKAIDKVIFADDANISEWAKDSVYFAEAKGIMHIVGSNKFAPKNMTEEETRANYANVSRQQAIIYAVRMHSMLKGSSGISGGENAIGEQCLNIMPKISFGKVESTKIDKDSAVVSISGATSADYDEYIEKAKLSFPEMIYTLPGINYKAWNNVYTINITFTAENGWLVVEVFKN